MGGTRAFLDATIDTGYQKDKIILAMSLIQPAPETRIYNSRSELPPGYVSKPTPGQRIVDRINQRGVLRAGYIPGRLPFTFRNGDHELVGFDIELLNMLAREMDVRLELVPLEWDTLKNQVNSGEVDIVGSMPLSTHMLTDLDLSDPYLPGEVSVIVRDHRRKEFNSIDAIVVETQAGADVLEEIATISRGEVVKAGNMEQLLDQIAALPEPEPEVRRLRIWCHPIWAGFLVLLLGLFWSGRKLVGII